MRTKWIIELNSTQLNAIERKYTKFNVIERSFFLNSMLSTRIQANSMLYWVEFQWIQCYGIKSQWIPWYIEWNSIAIECDPTELLNWIQLNSMLLKGNTLSSIYCKDFFAISLDIDCIISVNYLLIGMVSLWILCYNRIPLNYWIKFNSIQCYWKEIH